MESIHLEEKWIRFLNYTLHCTNVFFLYNLFIRANGIIVIKQIICKKDNKNIIVFHNSYHQNGKFQRKRHLGDNRYLFS